ncbi:MAG TPA: DUF4388 domain-containing protein [Gemmatimonadaceae bacterium]|nr:DUF4388 domain-containing protein [Gemmatimonadaceae bacterium]
MAIEGPLRELGIHDVFQLLDLSRKTGRLVVTSELRDNEGTVFFERGRVVAATIRSNPHRMGDVLLRSGKVSEGDIARARVAQSELGDRRRLGEILLEMGAITPKELERQVRAQIEADVFELLSWREGFFRFEEGLAGEHELGRVNISTESLLMEGARRIDEWSRIADRVPSLAAVPQLAPVQGEEAPQLDLLPFEWEVLARIDGEHDLRFIASQVDRSDFDVAKVVYGLVSTGVVELTMPVTHARVSGPRSSQRTVAPPAPMPSVEPPTNEQVDDLERGFLAVQRGDFDSAVKAWAQFLQTHPNKDWSQRVRGGLEAAARLRALLEARYGD